MSNQPEGPVVPEARSLLYLFRGQFLHAAAAVVLVVVAWALAAPGLSGGSWLGLRDVEWFWLTVGVTLLHHGYTWLAFRLQLGWGTFTRLFGRRDLAVHTAVFLPMLLARPLLVLATGLANPATLALSRWLEVGLGVAVLLPAAYAAWSVQRYFGVRRAAGGDHFRTKYREMPLVTEGAFGWTSNAMYTYVFLGLWSIALLTGSHVALVVALFQHAFIWAHHLGTERPDMDVIYGP